MHTLTENQMIENICQAAKKVPQAEWINEKCSLCREEVKHGNFCRSCGATFLSSEEIENKRLIFPPIAPRK